MSAAELICLAEVSSTNTWLKQHRGELSNGAAIIAERQTAGRGRTGHEWLDAEGMLPLSVLLRSPRYPQFITLGASLAVCEAVELLIGEPLGIKWPNDIILRGHKLCGILCESVYFGESCDIVCGVGINLTQPQEYFIGAGLPYGGSLMMLTGKVPDRLSLAEMLCERIYEFSRKSFADVYEQYKSRCITLGKEVRVISPRGERTAKAVDIAPDGNLICSDKDGRFAGNSGEVSVRGLYGYV